MVKDELYGLFLKYKTKVFIETGTHMGNGIDRALDIGYDKIFSVEIMEGYFNACIEKNT